jgi:hypothetical protein
MADLGEVTVGPRQNWAHALRAAREADRLHGSEFDPVMGQDLGLDKGTPFGVTCALGRPEGPESVFSLVERRSAYEEDPAPPLPAGFPIREKSTPGHGPLGRVIAVVQTFIWSLVRPHSCPSYMKYREGLGPAGHVEAREGMRRWKRDAIAGFVGIVVGAFLDGRLVG